MSQGTGCADKARHRTRWVVTQRRANRSAFGGYRVQRSDYSQVYCPLCEVTWRTKAAYVDALRDADVY